MKAKVALHSMLQQLRDTPALALLSAATLALASLDQCTRGPSLTAMVLTHLNSFF
jgi:hypothetical protein